MNKYKIINNMLTIFPISLVKRHEAMKNLMLFEDAIKNKHNNKDNISVIRSNSDYGHEYWIKKFSHWGHSIYGLIEHGLFLGRNSNMVGLEYDYEFRTILTYGDYREEVLMSAFPEYRIYKIGPRIAYAQTNNEYLEMLRNNSNGKKIMTLFPAHSSNVIKASYDVSYLVTEARRIMQDRGIDYLQVCLPNADIVNGNAEAFRKEGCNIVSAGKDPIDFLPRLRAIIESSDLTMSNTLGTNLGYCVYLGKMQILVPQQHSFEGRKKELHKELMVMHSSNSKEEFKKEENTFLELFSSHSSNEINNAQYKICDYYWGFSHVKSKNEIHDLLSDLMALAYQK